MAKTERILTDFIRKNIYAKELYDLKGHVGEVHGRLSSPSQEK